ncbi:MAG: hypothetical protein LBJ67_05235 [Planctomycetaceae bacterium]|nr:hypothetical protein [Planctomycetaceae bacterium]
MTNEKPIVASRYPIAVCRYPVSARHYTIAVRRLPIFARIYWAGRRNCCGLSKRLRPFPKRRPRCRLIHHLCNKVSAPSGKI